MRRGEQFRWSWFVIVGRFLVDAGRNAIAKHRHRNPKLSTRGDGNCDSVSLREAISAANQIRSADTIIF